MLSIVRLGGYNEVDSSILSHTSNFQQALISHYTNSKSKNTTVNINNNDDDTPTLQIKNKYFTALIRLQPLISSDTQTNDTNTIEDGIILTFPLTQPSSFDTLQSIHDNAIQTNQCGETIRLCIGICYNPSHKTTENEYSKRVLWCLDNGYEYIEADISDYGISKGHEEREKDSFARVIEAIEGTIWSSAIKNPPQALPTLPSSDQVNKATTSCQTNEDKSKQQLTKNDVNSLQVMPETNETIPKKEKDEEKMFDNLESVLQEAKQIRENSKAGVFSSDEERRNVASNTALKLMNLLNIIDDDSDDEE